MRGFNYQLAARVLVDAQVMGDEKAAKKHKVGLRSVERYRTRMQKDPELHTLVAKKTAKVDEDLRPAREAFQRDAVAFMQKVVARGEALLPKCNAEQFGEVAAAVKDVSEAVRNIGELDLAARILGVGNGDRGADPQAPEAGGPSPKPSADGGAAGQTAADR